MTDLPSGIKKYIRTGLTTCWTGGNLEEIKCFLRKRALQPVDLPDIFLGPLQWWLAFGESKPVLELPMSLTLISSRTANDLGKREHRYARRNGPCSPRRATIV